MRLYTFTTDLTLAMLIEATFDSMRGPYPGNEATNSSLLYNVIGCLLIQLNEYTPEGNQLRP